MSLAAIPCSPGSVIRDQILKQMQVKQADLARAMGVSKVRLNLVINGKAPLTPAMAVRLAHATRTEAEYWLGLQVAFELFQAKKKLASELSALPALISQSEYSEPAMLHVSH